MHDSDYNRPAQPRPATPGGKVMTMASGPSTLVVCTANICRSPMAEALWRNAAQRLRRMLPIVSVGLEARPGTLVDPVAMELLAERGIDLSDHRARRFDPVTAMRHHLVLVMEPEHQRRILVAAPALAGRVQLLGRWGPGPIEDPYGGSRPEYEHCLARLEQSVIAWLNRIVDGIDAHRHEQHS